MSAPAFQEKIKQESCSGRLDKERRRGGNKTERLIHFLPVLPSWHKVKSCAPQQVFKFTEPRNQTKYLET